MENIDIEVFYKKLLQGKKEQVSGYAKEYGGDRSMRPTQVGSRVDKWVSKEGSKALVSVAKIPLSFQKSDLCNRMHTKILLLQLNKEIIYFFLLHTIA